MIGFHIEVKVNGSYYHWINDNSKSIFPLPESFDQTSEDFVFFQTMLICRDNAIGIKNVELSGKHLRMFENTVRNIPLFFNQHCVHYHGDMASFVIHNCANWLV